MGHGECELEKMTDRSEPFDVRQVSNRSADYAPAIHMAMDLGSPSARAPDPQVADLQASARAGLVSIDLLFGAYRGGKLCSACLAIESPGGAAMVMLPVERRRDVQSDATVAALHALQRASWERSIRLLEVLLVPGVEESARVLGLAGFGYLTTLVYLTRSMGESDPVVSSGGNLMWYAYEPNREALFCEILEASYVQSLDCPELTGIRSASEVLATHRARRDFDPGIWWVAVREGAAVGVLLLNRISPQQGLEIVYVGVAQPSRGTGVADALLGRTMRAAKEKSAKFVTLAVDRRNVPARRMYARWNFADTLRRDAFFLTSPPA